MSTALSNLIGQQWGQDWLLGMDSEAFWHTVAVRSQHLSQLPAISSPATVLIAEADPQIFLASVWAAFQNACTVILANPQWQRREWQQVAQLMTADIVWGTLPAGIGIQPPKVLVGDQSDRNPAVGFPPAPHHTNPTIAIPTGGSSGNIKFALHTAETLLASVAGFRQHFRVDVINAYCVLPLHHVSGLMQALRVLVSGGCLAVQSFKALEQGDRLPLVEQPAFLSLVPTQLQRLLNHEALFAPFLQQFRAVLLGGAPPWDSLLHQARRVAVPLALTYGMTETASQIATLLPEEFRTGHQHAGRILPHATVQIVDGTGQPLPTGKVGHLRIQAASLALAYRSVLSPHPVPLTPALMHRSPGFQPDDLGYLDADGYLHIVGRHSTKIITGGENVFPEEVEAVLRAERLVQDICVIGLPDPTWGQAVTAVCVLADVPITSLKHRIKHQLSPHKHPKHWVVVKQLPRNAQGKVNRQRVFEIAREQVQSTSAG